MSMSLFWLIAMVLFGVLEAVTVGLTSIWFALGALGALVAAAASAPVIVQIVVFLGVSFLTLLLVRPLAQRFVNDRKVATNADPRGQHGPGTPHRRRQGYRCPCRRRRRSPADRALNGDRGI